MKTALLKQMDRYIKIGYSLDFGKIRLLALVTFMLCISDIHGQTDVAGEIHDDADNPIAHATIQLYEKDSTLLTGTHTDSIGRFYLKNISKGNYSLRISSLGYQSKTLDINVGKEKVVLPVVSLSGDSHYLEELTVTGSAYIRKKDHIIAIPNKEQKKHAFTGYDLLYNLMIPGLTIDRREGTVTTARGTASLYINGVEADMNEVKNLRPGDIEKVEYYDIPSGKYVGDVAAVNYVTKKRDSGGYVNIDAEQTAGYTKGNYNAAAKLIKGTTSYTFFGGYGMQKHNGTTTEKEETFAFTNNTVIRKSNDGNGKYTSNGQYAQLKISDNTDRHDISASLSFVRNETPHDDRQKQMTYGNALFEDNTAESATTQKNTRPQLQLKGIFHPAQGHELFVAIDGSAAQNDYGRLYTEGSQLSHSYADEELYQFSIRSSYDIQMKHDNTFSAQLAHFHNIASTTYTGDYNTWQHLWCGETMMYISYMQQFKNGFVINIYPGMSVLNYRVHGNKQQQFWTFRTNSWIMYRFNNEHYAGLGISTGNNQASLDYLSEADQTVDFLLTKRGNPNLGNTKYNDLFFSYEGQFKPLIMQITSTYSIIKNNITNNYFAENDKIIQSYVSDSDISSLTNEIQITSRFSQKIRFLAKLRHKYIHIDGEHKLSNNSYTASVDVNYFIKDYSLNLFAKTPEQTINNHTLAYVRNPGSYGLIARYNHGNFMAEIGTDTPFTHKNRYHESAGYGVYQYSLTRTCRVNQQTAWLKLACTFDFGKKTQKERNDVNRTINSAILKAE